MALAGTIMVGLMLLGGALNGLRRGASKEGLAFAGILLGALLVTLWVDRGGDALVSRTGWQLRTAQWVVALGLLWGTALFSGYGSGMLLPRRSGKLGAGMRAGGALLGLLNGGLLMAWSLRYTQLLWFGDTLAGQKSTWIRASPATRFLLARLDLLLLGIAWILAVISFVVLVVQVVTRLIAPRRAGPSPARSQPTSPRPISDTVVGERSQPPSPGMERSFLEKPRPPGGHAP